MLSFELSDSLKKIVAKLSKRDKSLALALRKKIFQIIECSPSELEHFKNLKGSKKHLKRAHVGSFVLVFYLKGNTIYFEDFDHHDKIYEKS